MVIGLCPSKVLLVPGAVIICEPTDAGKNGLLPCLETLS